MAIQNFTGFPKDIFDFYAELEDNNNRAWFTENKQRYLSNVAEPALDFITAMEKPLKKISPHFLAVPKRSGGSLMRIYRDIRFSKNKLPYKTNLGIHFRHEFGKDVHAPGFYFHFSLDEVFVGAGIWGPDKEPLDNIRQSIDEFGPRWKRIKGQKTFRETFAFSGSTLVRPPRGYEKDHPLIEDLKRKDFVATTALNKKILLKADLVNELSSLFKIAMPYMRFLCDALKLPC